MSSLRSRQQKRRTTRAPGIWRGGDGTGSTDHPVVEHGVRNQFGVSARLVSGLIVVTLLILLMVFFVTDYFYVRNITVVGTNYLDEAEVFRYADIAEMHVFWIDPGVVRESIFQADVVADVRIEIGWPPDMVRIIIEEREPALVWVQGGVSFLIDLQGRRLRVLTEDESHPELIWIMTDGSVEGLPAFDKAIPIDAVNGALQLQLLLAGIQQLRYHPIKGLGFREPGGWDAWFGVGVDMPNKLVVYETLRDNLNDRGVTPVEINVAHLEAVYYCESAESCYE
jgi:hypothetical protein